MIRKFERRDLVRVMEIWLNTNIQTHDFIAEDYWRNNFDFVKSMLFNAEIYVYEIDDKVDCFVGVVNGYIAGIFVSHGAQSQGIGKQLLDTIKDYYSELSLTVYKKNVNAVKFYQRELFAISKEQIDKNITEVEYLMVWNK